MTMMSMMMLMSLKMMYRSKMTMKTCHMGRGMCSLQLCRSPCTERTACLSKGSHHPQPAHYDNDDDHEEEDEEEDEEDNEDNEDDSCPMRLMRIGRELL